MCSFCFQFLHKFYHEEVLYFVKILLYTKIMCFLIICDGWQLLIYMYWNKVNLIMMNISSFHHMIFWYILEFGLKLFVENFCIYVCPGNRSTMFIFVVFLSRFYYHQVYTTLLWDWQCLFLFLFYGLFGEVLVLVW